MSVSLVDYLAQLPENEIDRLQKRLRIILRHCQEARRLRATLQNVFDSLGPPSRKLTALGPEFLKVFQKLLDNFGTLKSGQIDARERELLQKIPYVVFTDEEHCRLCAEAEQSLARDQFFREEGYLFNAIQTLPLKEKRAWAQWLQMGGNHLNRGNLERELYARMAVNRRRETAMEPANHEDHSIPQESALPEFLSDVFPEDDTRLPVAWFYRGVLPLYNALAETGKLASSTLNPLQKNLIEWMKVGQVVARSVTPAFGEQERWRLVWTRETVAETFPDEIEAELPTRTRQEQLQF